MKVKLSLIFGLAAVLLVSTIGLTQAQGSQPQEVTASLAAVGTGFTYQGQLKRDGQAVNSTCDFRFILYNAEPTTEISEGCWAACSWMSASGTTRSTRSCPGFT